MGIEDFPLAWRWTHSSHALLPPDVLASLVPLQFDAADRLYRRGEEVFREAAGSRVRHAAEDPVATRSWLQSLPFPMRGRISLAWSRTLGVSLPWHSFVAYWDDFCYPSSDDLFGFPEVGDGALAWDHEEVFAFVENAL
jgi:hypothetical protein